MEWFTRIFSAIILLFIGASLHREVWTEAGGSSPISVNAITAPHQTTGWLVYPDEEAVTLPAGMMARIRIETPEEIEAKVHNAYAYQTFTDGVCTLVFPPTLIEMNRAAGYARFRGYEDHDSFAHEMAHCVVGDWHGDVALRRALHGPREPLKFPVYWADLSSWVWYYQWAKTSRQGRLL